MQTHNINIYIVLREINTTRERGREKDMDAHTSQNTREKRQG
jgi:hypothetical protein